MGTAKDQVIPLRHIVAEQFTHLRVVQHRTPLAQAEGDRLHGRTGQFVNARHELLAVHGGLVAVDMWVPTVMVEPDAWCRH